MSGVPGYSVIDCTGISTGNSDLEGSSTWNPPQGEPDRAPLPGHEHQQPGVEPLQAGDPEPFLPWLTENTTIAICALLTVLVVEIRLIFGG